MSLHPTLTFQKLLVANRSEIAIRIFRAATELGLRTVAIYAEEDALSLHRFKADEAYALPACGTPISAYLSIDNILKIARRVGADALHPGYGLLSESPELADRCEAAGIVFVGPSAATMRMLGDKTSARRLAVSRKVPVMPASEELPGDDDATLRIAAELGYPLMLKASWGGGGRGMRRIAGPETLLADVAAGRREARAAFGRDEVYLERFVADARHVEVQLLGDRHGNLVHLHERDCSLQRRRQKVVERAPAIRLAPATRDRLFAAALELGRAADYVGAGTVEFLVDEDDRFFFIEVNPRVQVEHTVTEMVTGIDIVQAQLLVASGGRIGDVNETGVPAQDGIFVRGHAIQCRITTEDAENNFIPDYGRITAYRGAFGFGVRVDGGTAYAGAVVTRHFDPLLEKLTTWAPTVEGARRRMLRAVREFRIRGVATNLPFLERLVTHPSFAAANYTTAFIDDTPELFDSPFRRDRATKLLTYLAEVSVRGHPDVAGRPVPRAVKAGARAGPPRLERIGGVSLKRMLDERGAQVVARWTRAQTRALVTDTTLRDAHQSLFATRMRTIDIVWAASRYPGRLDGLYSVECWGGATFDVAMRFLDEDPWARLAAIRRALPDTMLQMLLRGANAVGYTNYPDNVVERFIAQAAISGVDVFRVFDCFNWVPNMRVAIDAVVASGKMAQGAICYTGDLMDPGRSKFGLDYYLAVARDLVAAGCHSLAVKDMAGVLKPAAAMMLFQALRAKFDVPLHLHTHDTAGGSLATLLAAVAAGADVVDTAVDAMSGTTSQPSMGSLVESLRWSAHDTLFDPAAVREVSGAYAAVRGAYAPFDSEVRSGLSEVYRHEMPGGQITNLQEQARGLGLDGRWEEIVEAYRDANLAFGDIVKVTPSSKVVGDLALMMVAQNLSASDLVDPARDVSFPASVVEMLRGELGQPSGGWPKALQERVLRGEAPLAGRPGAALSPVDFEKTATVARAECGEDLDDERLLSWLLYPKVTQRFLARQRELGPLTVLPTRNFWYGMRPGDEIPVELESGKVLLVRLLAVSDLDDDGSHRIFFELNGQPRTVVVQARGGVSHSARVTEADPLQPGHVASPMPGTVGSLQVSLGSVVKTGDLLLTVEAMKMESSVVAPIGGTVVELSTAVGRSVQAKQLLVVIEAIVPA